MPYQGFLWDIDVFKGHLERHNLVICEIELTHPKEEPPLPPWVGREVTFDKHYRNSHLARGKDSLDLP